MPFLCSPTLRGQRVLVAEDCYLIAEELVDTLEREGAEVVGPVSTLDDARRIALGASSLDAAILDVNLRGQMIWPVADILSGRHVKLVFATGYAAASIRRRYGPVQVAQKPAPARMVVRLLSTERSAAQDVPKGHVD